ncbi:MAG: hypothetical protein A3H02_01730 [Candidatus Niyogibacteria bacterium RIFCSPLOWO2_12_FULL_41_13]|uniref:Zinc finger DksA/TraR C4-type domain-containing protein n=1 Tax=Candidatus Niyogibacteria bacterium RIFCSPLOWO2_12_FULL_41_13 TaxID=1801726 RepID=A0A1G2F114_9BACT|nr:MAG: hypothetical protein A3H02_01730 [Candidatus Niyogibacteria bacterium RIFCSPLOWO2_12_FULL_41_13]
MNKKDLDYFSAKLKAEKERLEKELSGLATKNPENPENWIPSYPDFNPQLADESEKADVVEEFEIKYSVETVLEEKLNEVKEALQRIAKGTYGVCEEDKEPISRERLEANPAAKYCQKHAQFK